MGSNATVNPFEQSFTLVTGAGTSVNVAIPDVDAFILYNTQIGINYGAQIGASIVLLIVLLLLTKPEKRSSPIFLLNSLSLVLNIIRNVLQCLYYTGAWSEFYAYFAQDYSLVKTGDYAQSITGVVFTFLVLICVEISLCLQVRAVCFSLRRSYRQALFAFSMLTALMAVAFRLALVVENAKLIVKAQAEDSLYWIASGSNIMTSISTCWFSIVFITKLGFALHQRRKLGLGQFGPMQIIFIMGCQTLIVPAIFSILPYCTNSPAISSNVLTVVAIFIPLSALWASASIEHRTTRTSQKQPLQGNKTFESYASRSTGPLSYSKAISDNFSSSNTATSVGGDGSNAPIPLEAGPFSVFGDLEAQGLASERRFGREG